jgi:hypothetical protein
MIHIQAREVVGVFVHVFAPLHGDFDPIIDGTVITKGFCTVRRCGASV